MSAKIEAQLSLDGALFKRGLHEAGTEAGAFLKNFALGAVGAYSIEQAFDKTVESATELVNASRKLGVTVEQLQVLRQAAEDNGVEFDAMTQALLKFNATRENVLHKGKGSDDQLAALGRLGVTPEVLKSLQSNLPEQRKEGEGGKVESSAQSIEDQRKQAASAANVMMGQISDYIRRNNLNPADVAKDLKDVFGKSGQQIFGVLQTNFEELQAKMQDMGAIMDGQVAYKLKALGEELGLISRILTAQLGPALLTLAEFAFKAIAKAGGAASGIGAFFGYAFQRYQDSETQSTDIDSENNKAHADAIRRAGNAEVGGRKENMSQTLEAMKNVAQPWEKMIEDFRLMLKNAADRANNIPAPIGDDGSENAAKTKRPKATQSDSLISVGNFLGAGRVAINSVAERHLEVARQQLAAQQAQLVESQKITLATQATNQALSALREAGVIF